MPYAQPGVLANAYTVIPYIKEKRVYAITSSTTPVQVICYSATDPETVSYNTVTACPAGSSLGSEIHTFTGITTAPPINRILLILAGWKAKSLKSPTTTPRAIL